LSKVDEEQFKRILSLIEGPDMGIRASLYNLQYSVTSKTT